MKSPKQEKSHNFPKWLSSSGVLWSSPAQNPLSPQDKSEVFVIKDHRQIIKTLWILDFMI